MDEPSFGLFHRFCGCDILRSMAVMRFFLTVLVISSACFAQSQPATHRERLKQTTEIQSWSCAKGYAWLYTDGHLESCIIAKEMPFGDAQAPAGSFIRISDDGKPMFLGLSYSTKIHDYTCEGGGSLGPAEGPTTAFYPSGRLKVCFLDGDQTVQGVPCMGAGGFLTAVFRHNHNNPSANFYEDGKLKSCTLSKNFGGQNRSELFSQGD